ncbi:hypothetical protein [Helicobacter zhangjianzhongii]|nr:hypothetical protein [Helicobacter sp. CPD2-1]MDL0079382.1 hypothetical protein [Helicobacter sp. CPD2-1]
MGFNPRIHFLHFWRLLLESTFQKVDSSMDRRAIATALVSLARDDRGAA